MYLSVTRIMEVIKGLFKAAQINLEYNNVVIGNNVWIGQNAVILAGSNIGDGAVVGANSVINSKIPASYIVVGNNRLVKRYDFDEKKWIRL